MFGLDSGAEAAGALDEAAELLELVEAVEEPGENQPQRELLGESVEEAVGFVVIENLLRLKIFPLSAGLLFRKEGRGWGDSKNFLGFS